MKTKRLLALLLCALTLLSLFPMTGLAVAGSMYDGSSVNATSIYNCFEYYNGSIWQDLDMPKLSIWNGAVFYGLERNVASPNGEAYTSSSAAMTNYFSAKTVKGLHILAMNSFPNIGGLFSDDEMYQASQAAIYFWMAEQGEANSLSYLNRKQYPTYVRAKSGYESVLAYVDEILGYARAQEYLPHSISFSPMKMTLSADGNTYSGQTKVMQENLAYGYTLNSSSLPSGSNITGFTGRDNDTLTITVPASAAGNTYTLTATGKDHRVEQNNSIFLPPSGSSKQKLLYLDTSGQVVANATFDVVVPLSGSLSISASESSQFGIYSDSGCGSILTTLAIDSSGTSTADDLPVGTVYVKQLSAVSPYIIDSEIKSATIVAGNTSSLSFANATATGKIRIVKTGDIFTSNASVNTDFGTVSTPEYENKGLVGVKFEVKNSLNVVVATLTTNSEGIAETSALPLGSYTVHEISAPLGYVVDTTAKSVALAYKDNYTPIVSTTVNVSNSLNTGKIKLKNTTERFNADSVSFETVPAERYVFGLFTAQTVGEIPSNVLVELITTDAQGVAQTSNPYPFGNYYLKQLGVPDETIVMIPDRLALTVSSALNTFYFDTPIANEMFKAKIGVYVSDAASSTKMLSGAVLGVRTNAGALYDTVTTNADGYAETKAIPVGEYKVKESTPPSGFVLSDEVKSITLTTADKTTAVLEMKNTANEIKLRVTDSLTKLPIANVPIKVINSNGGSTFFEGNTAADGYVTVKKIPAGSYTWQITLMPSGYATSSTAHAFTVDAYGKSSGETEIAIEPTVFEFTKINAYNNKPLANVTFALQDSRGAIVKTKIKDGYRAAANDGDETFVTDENGKVAFKYLPIGQYKLVETVPVGFLPASATDISITSTSNTATPLKASITNCPTGVKLFKIDAETNAPLTGAGFRIKVKDGSDFKTLMFTPQTDGKYLCSDDGTVMDITVDDKGEAYILGLPLCDVWIEESIVPEGYFPISARKVEITKDMSALAPLEIQIPNSKSVKLGFDTDKYNVLIAICACVLVCGGVAFLVIWRRRKMKGMR